MEESAHEPLRMLNKALKESTKKPQEEKYELPKRSIEELLYYSINAYQECKWYQYFTKRVWREIIKLIHTDNPPEELTIGLSNLDGNVVEISQSITQFVTPITQVDLLRVDVKDELAVNLINKGIIKFTESRGVEFKKETVTIKASINVKQ